MEDQIALLGPRFGLRETLEQEKCSRIFHVPSDPKLGEGRSRAAPSRPHWVPAVTILSLNLHNGALKNDALFS